VDALRKDVSRLEANLEKEIGRVHMVQQEMQKRSPAKATVQMPVTELADLFPLVNHLNKKVDGLEAEVARLKHVVEDAYERTIGEIRPEATRQQRRVVSDEAEVSAVLVEVASLRSANPTSSRFAASAKPCSYRTRTQNAIRRGCPDRCVPWHSFRFTRPTRERPHKIGRAPQNNAITNGRG